MTAQTSPVTDILQQQKQSSIAWEDTQSHSTGVNNFQ